MNIVLFGIQGSGKGTLVLDLEKHLKFSLISMGQLLREEVATGSALGKRLKEIMDKGNLVDAETIMKVIGKKLSNTTGICIFDGFPRNKEQADALEKVANVDLVLYLNLPKEKAIERIVNRLTCKVCGNIASRLSTNSTKCSKCGGQLATRSDDTHEAVEKRFKLYESETYPLLEKYRAQGKVVELDATKTPKEVLDMALKVIKNEHKN